MAEVFDPYYEWLGIPPKDQPPHHYRLLGIELYEPNLNVIERAADRQMAHVRSYQSGKHSTDSQRLLNELSTAKVCLLNPQRKTDYDQQLQQQFATRSAPATDLPTDEPIPELPPGVPAALVTRAPLVTPAAAAAAAVDVSLAANREASGTVHRRRTSSFHRQLVSSVVAIIVLFGGPLGYYFFTSRTHGSGQSSNGDPGVVPADPVGSTSSAGQGSSPPESSTGPGTPPAPKPSPSRDTQVAVIDESATEIMDPNSLPAIAEIPNTVRETITAAAGMVDDRFAFCQTLLWGRFDEIHRALRTQGFRVSRFRPYQALGEWRVAAIWLRDGLPSRVVGLIDATSFQQAQQRLSEQGFVPVDVVGVADNERERFAAAWVKPMLPVGSMTVTLGVSEDAYQVSQAQMRQDGYCSAVHGVYFDSAGKKKYCDLWVQSSTVRDGTVWMGDQAEAAKQMAQDAIHADVGVTFDQTAGLLYTGSQWPGVKDVAKAYVGMIAEGLQNEATSLVAAGFVPSSLSVAPAGGQLVGVSLWRPADQLHTPLELASLTPDSPPISAPTSMPSSPSSGLALRFAGQGSVELRDSVGLANIASDFTVEAWLRFHEQAYGTANILFGTAAYRGLHPAVTSMGMKGWLAGIKPARPGSAAKSQFIFQWAESSGQVQTHTGDILAFDDQWHHLALCNHGTRGNWELVVYVDGAEVLRASHSDSKDAPSPVGVYFGRPPYIAASRRALHGNVRALRLSSGIRYSSSFQPEEQRQSDPQTLSLLDFTTASGLELRDRSSNGRHGAVVDAVWVDADGSLVPNANPLVSSPDVTPGVARLSVPANPDAQIAQVREVFKGEIAAAKDPLAWSALATKMLSHAADEQNPAVQYALFEEARRLAIDGIDWNVAARSIDELSSRFKVDPWGLRSDVFSGLAKKTRVPADRKLLAETAVTQADAALGENALEAAESMLSSAATLARGERDLIKQVNDLKKRLTDEKKTQQLVRDARAKLAEAPQDQSANEALGKYLCFAKDDWETGLQHLAQGPAGKLSALAHNDAARPTDAADRQALAEGWSEFARTTPDVTSKSGGINRALYWYQLALPDLTGVHKLQAEKQIEELSKSAPSTRGKGRFAWLDGDPGIALELRGHTADVTCLAVARSGRFVVSGSLDDTVRKWDLSTGKQIGRIVPGIGDVTDLLLSADERTVALPVSVAGEYNIGIWILQTGQPLGTVKADGMARQLAGSQDWRHVAYSKNQNGPANILVYNLMNLTPVAQLTCPTTAVELAVSRTGRFVAAADTNNVVYVWDIQTGKLSPLTGHTEQVSGLAISPNERQLVSCSNRALIVWDLVKGLEERRITIPTGTAAPTAIAFTPDGSRLLASGMTHELLLFNVQQGSLHAQIRASDTSNASSTREIVSLPDGRGAAMSGYDSLIRIWRLPQ